MKLHQFTLKYLAIATFLILSVWSVVFYVNMLDEVYDSLDDGLDNYRMLVLKKAEEDGTVLGKTAFDESNYAIRELPSGDALKRKDTYKDTLMYMADEEDMEPVRMLTTAFRKGDKYYELKIISSMVEEDDLIEDLFFALIWLYLFLLASILLVNNVLLRKTWKSFYGTLHLLRNFKLGREEVPPAQETRIEEFRELNQTVSDLLLRTNRTYQSQKQFIENASHELQTPLAISLTRLELLAENEAIPEPERNAIAQVIRTMERMKRLNKSLLLLSRIENRQFPDEEDVAIGDVIRLLLEEFEDLVAYRKLTIVFREETPQVVKMNKDLALIFLTNFIKNAVVHNKEKGTVEILLVTDGLTIANTGQEKALDETRLFQRFYQEGLPGKNSTGLGLAINKAIADNYGLRVSYRFDGLHHWHVKFPGY